MNPITYNPAHFAAVPHLGIGAQPQEAQTVWQQLDRETWLQVEIRRNPQGYSTAPYVKEARLLRGQRSDGGWQSAHIYANAHQLQLLEDTTAAAPRAPAPPEVADNAATRYIAKHYGTPEIGPPVDIHKVRAKQGMW